MSNNKKIAKNTGFLYIRMLLMMGIAFFSSRVLLRELGVSDFGLYGVVGGVVAMFNSLRGIFASSIQRFLNFEMGKGNKEQLAKIFSTGVTIHIVLSFIFLLFTETVGLWFLNNKLVIEPDRLIAANWVFQFSVLASIVTIMTIPYDAVIIANERMKAFAYISILDASFKLGIIFIVSIFASDKLILYAVLILFVSFITRGVSMIYCSRTFEECKYKFYWDKGLFKQIGGFAGWNFIGNTTFTLSNEGVNMLLNIFGGAPVNAARAIAYQVRSVTSQFTSNILMSVNPHMIKLYSQDKKQEFDNFLFFTSKVIFFVMLILCTPIIIFADTILTLWLVNVPDYTVSFVELILILSLVNIFNSPIDTLFKATGKIKKYQIIQGSIGILILPISYILLKNNLQLHSVFVVMIIASVANLIATIFLAHKMRKLNMREYLLKTLIPCFLVSIIAIPFSFILVNTLKSTELFVHLLYLLGVLSIIAFSILAFGFTNREREILKNYLVLLKKRHI